MFSLDRFFCEDRVVYVAIRDRRSPGGDLAGSKLRTVSQEIGSMRTIVTCPCGATYERTETNLTPRTSNEFQCDICGETLERWNGSRLPQFRLVEVRESQ